MTPLLIIEIGDLPAGLLEAIVPAVTAPLRCQVIQERPRLDPRFAYDPVRGQYLAAVRMGIECGFDIFNPVQCSAAGMDPQGLKDKYGPRVVFWGGGVDTQQTLPFGSPAQVRAEAEERIRILGREGGLVFNTIHNIQAGTPTENVIALFEAVAGRPLRR